MPAQLRAALLVILGLDCREVRIERRLHVHHDVALLRHVHHHVRPNGAGVGVQMQLLGKIDARGHAGQLDQPAQGDLAPLPAHIRPAQSGDEVARFTRQGGLSHGERFHLRLEGRE